MDLPYVCAIEHTLTQFAVLSTENSVPQEVSHFKINTVINLQVPIKDVKVPWKDTAML